MTRDVRTPVECGPYLAGALVVRVGGLLLGVEQAEVHEFLAWYAYLCLVLATLVMNIHSYVLLHHNLRDGLEEGAVGVGAEVELGVGVVVCVCVCGGGGVGGGA